MGKRVYRNAASGVGKRKEYKISATIIGIKIMCNSKMVGTLLYEKLSNSITNERELLQAVNEFIIKRTGEKNMNIICYDFKEDAEAKELFQILANNRVAERQSRLYS